LKFLKATRKSFKERSLLKDEKRKDIRLGLGLALMNERGRSGGGTGARSGLGLSDHFGFDFWVEKRNVKLILMKVEMKVEGASSRRNLYMLSGSIN